MTSPQDILREMLTLTEYEGNKEEVIQAYLESTTSKAIRLLLRLQDESKQARGDSS